MDASCELAASAEGGDSAGHVVFLVFGVGLSPVGVCVPVHFVAADVGGAFPEGCFVFVFFEVELE